MIRFLMKNSKNRTIFADNSENRTIFADNSENRTQKYDDFCR
ncbi:hypothetical protein T06_7705 [Trichinella sp. T6]|nr:hypothetical protein T06_7705 [Trichinella sp. T6]